MAREYTGQMPPMYKKFRIVEQSNAASADHVWVLWGKPKGFFYAWFRIATFTSFTEAHKAMKVRAEYPITHAVNTYDKHGETDYADCY